MNRIKRLPTDAGLKGMKNDLLSDVPRSNEKSNGSLSETIASGLPPLENLTKPERT